MNANTSYAGWQNAARKMVSDACLAAYITANTKPTGERYAKHRQYQVPEWARPLLDALEADDEVETKRIMSVVRIGAMSLV